MKTIDKETNKSYTESYPNIVEILEHEKWIYNDLVIIENDIVISKQMHRILQLKDSPNYRIILRAVNKIYKDHCKREFLKLYNFEKSPKELYEELNNCIKFYNYVTEPSIDNIPNISALKKIKFHYNKLIIKRDYYIEIFEQISYLFLKISTVILDLEFISQFLTNDEDISYFIAGDAHVLNVSDFFNFFKWNYNAEKYVDSIVNRFYQEWGTPEKCTYLRIMRDEII